MISRRLFVFLAVIALAPIGCERKPAATPAADKHDGSPRLALLSPAMAVTLRDLGRADLIVGRHGFDMVTPQNVPIVGSQNGLDYEVLLNVKPTHVLLEAGASDLPPRLVEIAAKEGWKVRALPMLTLDNVRTALRVLDEITRDSGGEALSEQAQSLLTRFDTSLAVNPEAASRLGRVLSLAWTDPVGVLGPGSFHAQLMQSLGATPVPADGSAYITWSVEDVVKLDPDSIVLLLPGSKAQTTDEALGPLARANLRAAREGRVLIITDPLCHSPSTALANLADQIVLGVKSWPTIAR